VTHEYTILTGGIVLLSGSLDAAGAELPTAIAWAGDTVLAVGSDAGVLAISRGDSHVFALRGAFVVPLGAELAVGAPADFRVLDGDPTAGGRQGVRTVALVRAGRVVEGALPG
jgi:predicted amidohydrolase YtcJ